MVTCDYPSTIPGIVTEDQARDWMAKLKELALEDDKIIKKHEEKLAAINGKLDTERQVTFTDGVTRTIGEQSQLIRERLIAFGERMEPLTVKVDGVGQIARRMNKEKITLTGGKEQLDHVQERLAERLVTVLREADLSVLLTDEEREEMKQTAEGRAKIKELGEVELLGLYRLAVEPDLVSIRAKLGTGELKPEALPSLGYQWEKGAERVDITVK